MATLTSEIAQRAYEKLQALSPEVYVTPWNELAHSVRLAFCFMVMEGSEAGAAATLASLMAEDQSPTDEGATWH